MPSESIYTNIAVVFWGVVALAIIGYLLHNFWTNRPRKLPILKTVAQLEEATTKVVRQKQLPSADSRGRKGRRTLPILEYVDFDPKDKEHCIALRMLIEQPSRLHPTLRFHFDPSAYDSAPSAIQTAVSFFHIDRVTKPKANKKPDLILGELPPAKKIDPFPTAPATSTIKIFDSTRRRTNQ